MAGNSGCVSGVLLSMITWRWRRKSEPSSTKKSFIWQTAQALVHGNYYAQDPDQGLNCFLQGEFLTDGQAGDLPTLVIPLVFRFQPSLGRAPSRGGENFWASTRSVGRCRALSPDNRGVIRV